MGLSCLRVKYRGTVALARTERIDTPGFSDRLAEPGTALRVTLGNPKEAGMVLEKRHWVMKEMKSVWEKSRYEKGRSVGGKKFVHIMDDVKDHFADRRPGLEYMIAPFERMNLETWISDLNKILQGYAKAHDVPVEGIKEPRLED